MYGRMIAFIVSFAVLTSCTQEEIIEPAAPLQPDMENRHRLVEETERTIYTPEEFSESFIKTIQMYTLVMGMDLGGDGSSSGLSIDSEDLEKLIGSFVEMNYRILGLKFVNEYHLGFNFVKQNFTYRSVRANGDSATFSGSVIYPAPASGVHTLDGICLLHAYANADNNSIPSKIYDIFDIRAIYNQALVFSDTEGFGADFGSYVPYFDGFAKGRQTVDAAIAAKEILDRKNIRFSRDYYSENIGVSLGGNAALGTQKYLESDQCPHWVEEEVLPDFSTFATDCPSSISGVFDYYCMHDTLFFPFTVPMMVSTMYAQNPEIENEFSYTDFFDEHINDRKVRNSNNVKVGELDCFFQTLSSLTRMFTTFQTYKGVMRNFMNHSLFTEDGTLDRSRKRIKLLYSSLEKSEISNGWTPSHPLLMTHSTEDNVIPFSTAQATMDVFERHNGNAVLIPTQGVHITSSCISLIVSSVLPRPSRTINVSLLKDYDISDILLKLQQLTDNM